MAIYFSIDAILNKNNPNTSFLEGKRLKTRKILGVISQGLLGPLEWIRDYNIDPTSLKEDDDITEQMLVKKYIPRKNRITMIIKLKINIKHQKLSQTMYHELMRKEFREIQNI